MSDAHVDQATLAIAICDEAHDARDDARERVHGHSKEVCGRGSVPELVDDAREEQRERVQRLVRAHVQEHCPHPSVFSITMTLPGSPRNEHSLPIHVFQSRRLFQM